MNSRLLMVMLIALCFSVSANSDEPPVFSESRVHQEDRFNAKQTVGHLFGTNSLDSIVLYPIGPHRVYSQKGNEDAVRAYVDEFSKATVHFLSDVKHARDLETRLKRIALVRDKLMRASGYANSTLAGTLTTVLHAHLWNTLNQGEALSKDLLRISRISLVDVLNLVHDSANRDKKNACFSTDVLQGSIRSNDMLLSILGKTNAVALPARGVRPNVWRQLEPEGFSGMGFRIKSLDDSNSASHLYNWLLLLDEQHAIEMINVEVAKDSDFVRLDMDEAKARIDTALNAGSRERKHSNLRPWNGREVYNYFRKFRYGNLDGTSPLNTRVRLALERR